MNRRARISLVIVAAILVLLASGVFLLAKGNPYSRWAWKNRAVAEISRQAKDPAWLATELASMRSATNSPIESDAWLSRNLIVMTNGDWVAYRNICRKQNFWIRDLFIGRGSDGHWYYSTYHFCINMFVLSGMSKGQPASIAEFTKSYDVRQFDGQSNECLKSTRP